MSAMVARRHVHRRWATASLVARSTTPGFQFFAKSLSLPKMPALVAAGAPVDAAGRVVRSMPSRTWLRAGAVLAR